ncbi:hypothetical protein V6N11_009216 [Hibiscus sabdariffa]|uniref:Uncharacterized protein n=1 Tax=Hibiscus sabdariffa TaxID=183260 RepID=A0ABR2PQ01_9ROSI
MLVADMILQMGLDAMVRRKQTLQFLLSLVERCHGKTMLISSKDKEPLRESTDSDEAGLCITGDVGSIDSNQTTFGIDQLSELYALQDRLEEFDYKLEDVQSEKLEPECSTRLISVNDLTRLFQSVQGIFNRSFQFMLSHKVQGNYFNHVHATCSDEVDIGVERDKKMSGGTPVAGGSMRQRHSQGYSSDNEDLKDDACSRLQPFSPAAPFSKS